MNFPAEYFVVIGVTEQKKQSAKNIELDSSDGLDFTDSRYTGTIVDRFPEIDHPQWPLPPHIWMFCFPEGIKIYHHMSPPSPSYAVNVLTQMDGTRMYIAYLTFYEASSHPSFKRNLKNISDKLKRKLTLSNMQENQTDHQSTSQHTVSNASVYIPKCICLISRYPFFSTFKDFLANVYFTVQGSSRIPIERYISNFICEANFPSSGNVKLQIQLPAATLVCTIPPSKDFDIVDFSLHHLFDTLDVDNILRIIECILCEKKILFTTATGNHLLLTYVIESLLALIYPFYWPYVYVPVIPVTLVTFLEAPTPFILGICRSPEEINGIIRSLSEIVVVDLDRNRLRGVDPNVPYLPHRNTLHNTIRAAVHPELYTTGHIVQDKKRNKEEDLLTARKCMLECFTSLFLDWRSFITVSSPVEEKNPLNTSTGTLAEPPSFSKQSFLNSLPKENQKFIQVFINSYIFDLFVEEHCKENSLNLFDDNLNKRKPPVQDKLRTSIERFVAEKERRHSTENPDLRSSTIVLVTKPQADGLHPDANFNYNAVFPKLNTFYYLPAARAEEPKDRSNSPLYSNRRRAVQGFDYDVLVRAASGSLPDEVDVAVFFMSGLMQKLFKCYSLDILEIAQLCDLLKKDYGRHQFVRLLHEHKVQRNSSVLPIAVFEMLANLMEAALAEAQVHEDFLTAKMLMLLGSSFSLRKQNGSNEFIRSRLKNRPMWQNIDFWQYVLTDDLKSQVAIDPHEPESFGPSKKETNNKQSEISNVVFGMVVNIAYSMVNFSLSGKTIMFFVHKMCEEYQLSEEQSATLKSMIEKMCNFCVDSPAAEPRNAHGILTPSTPTKSSQPPSTPVKSMLINNLEKKAKIVKHLIEKASKEKSTLENQ